MARTPHPFIRSVSSTDHRTTRISADPALDGQGDTPKRTHLGSFTIPDIRDDAGVVRAVEAALPDLASKAWAMHPNNPANKKH